MNITKQEVNQKICDEMTQLQADLERALNNVLDRAGSRIRLEKQEKVKQDIETTKQILERFKSRYAPFIPDAIPVETSGIVDSWVSLDQRDISDHPVELCLSTNQAK